MHLLKCSLLATILCATFTKGSVAQTEFLNDAAGTLITVGPKKNEINYQFTESAVTETITSSLTANPSQKFKYKEDLISEQKAGNITKSNQISLKSNQEQDVENVTYNDIKPFLLFPILPFLFPPKEDESLNSDKNEFSISKNKTSKADENLSKPFIFLDFSLIRRIPLNNSTGSFNDSKIINVKKLKVSESEDLKNSHKSRERRNANNEITAHGFFDHSPLFPDTELEEFLPRPDLFLPDLPFHHKSLKKLSRHKRDQKKSDFKNDLKFFFDAFDDAFMRTKRELERADPILNFLRGSEQSYDEEKKEDDDFFSHLPVIQEKPRVKWKIQRNIKQLNNDHQDRLKNGQGSPMILVDKVVKIGEFHMYDEAEDKDKLKKKKKREMSDSKKNSREEEATTHENDETFSKNIFELIKQEENKRKKRDHLTKSDEPSYTKIQSEEIKILPQMNTSFLSFDNNVTIEVKKKGTGTGSRKVNTTEKVLKYGNFRKVIDSLKTKIKEELTNSAVPTQKRLKRKNSSYYDELNSKKASYDSLKKNISELLSQFLELAKNIDDAKLVKRLKIGELNNPGVLDWTEKETLQNTNMLGNYPREKRQKKNADSEDEYVDLGKKERQIAELNYLFLTVTLPTVFIFALALLVCFFSLQVKGKICSRLFRPRQIFITEDESPTQLKCSTKIKTQPKAQAI